MRGLKFSALFAAIVLTAPAALAADVVRPYTPPPVGGWYLRGDVGYKWYGAPEAIFNGPTFAGGAYPVPGAGELFNETMGPAWAFGGGVGYDPAGPHRFDFTIDYESPSRFEGNLTCTSVAPPCGAPSYSIETADITAWTGLFNAYIDFGGHPYIKPYVGIGAGFSALTTTNVISVDPTPATTLHTGATHWNFAWALMAGITKDITPTLKLDLGYRYLNLGEARSGIIDDGSGPPPAPGETGFFQYQHIHAHELRIGFRHML